MLSLAFTLQETVPDMDATGKRIEEVEHYLANVKCDLVLIGSATSASDLRSAWEKFLASYARTIGRLIQFGHDDHRSRGWSHKLKNASSLDDPGLTFLREARNTVEHGLEAFATFCDPAISIGGFGFNGAGNLSMTFQGNFVNGRPMGDFHIETRAGRVVSLEGRPLVPVLEVPTSIQLKEVRNIKKKIVVPVPASLMGTSIEVGKPVDLAQKATEFASGCLQELKALWDSKSV